MRQGKFGVRHSLKTAWQVAAFIALMALPASAGELRDSLDASLSAGDTQKILMLIQEHKVPADQVEITSPNNSSDRPKSAQATKHLG